MTELEIDHRENSISPEDLGIKVLGSLRSHNGNGNCNVMLLLFKNFRFKRLLVFRSNLCPQRHSEVVLSNFTTWILHSEAFEAKLNLFKCLSSKKHYGIQASLSYRRPYFGLVDDYRMDTILSLQNIRSRSGMAGVAVLGY